MMYRSNLSWFLAMTVIVGISSASVLYDFEGGGPGFTVNGNATVHNGSMRLTENAGSLSGSVIFDPISTAPVTGFEASFDFRALNADGADGMSFALLNSSFYGPTAVFGEAGPGANSLSIGIDLYDNGGEPQVGGNYFDIRLNGTVIASATPSFTMEGTGWHHVSYCQMLWMRFFWLGALRDGLAMIRNRFAGCLYLFIHPASEARFRSTGAVCPAPYPASAGG